MKCPHCQNDFQAEEDADDRLALTTRSAVVTRYPTGCFAIDYQGSPFFWWGFEEDAVHAELRRLRIPADRVEWQERYYDRNYDFSDPRSYRTRPFIPQNKQFSAPCQETNECTSKQK